MVRAPASYVGDPGSNPGRVILGTNNPNFLTVLTVFYSAVSCKNTVSTASTVVFFLRIRMISTKL